MTRAQIQAARERRATVWQEMQHITTSAGDRALTQEEINRWDALEGELRTLTGQIDDGERQLSIRDRMGVLDSQMGDTRQRPLDASQVDATRQTDEQARGQAFVSFLRSGQAGLTPEERQSLGNPEALPPEARALGIATGAAGGFFVPEGFRARIVETLRFYASIAPFAETLDTATGNPLPWPTNNDTGNKGAILSENTQVGEQDVTIGTDQLGAYTYTSKMVRVSIQLIQDSAFNVEDWLRRRLGERLGRAVNEHYTVGTGASQPQGIVTGAAVGKTGPAGQLASVTFDDLVDLIHSVDPAYRNERARFSFHDLALAAFRKEKDGDGRPLWQPSVTVGQPDTILGRPYVVNNDMPVPAANAKSVLFGDIQAGYVIRTVLGIQMLRLSERYADYLQIAFLAFLRTDAKVQDAQAVKVFQHAGA